MRHAAWLETIASRLDANTLAVFAGAGSYGKKLFPLELAACMAAKNGHSVLCFSLEEDMASLSKKMVAINDFFEFESTIVINDGVDFTADKIYEQCAGKIMTENVGFVVFDYLQLSCEREGYDEALATFHKIAREFHVSVFLSVALPKDRLYVDGRQPQVADLEQPSAFDGRVDDFFFIYPPDRLDTSINSRLRTITHLSPRHTEKFNYYVKIAADSENGHIIIPV